MLVLVSGLKPLQQTHRRVAPLPAPRQPHWCQPLVQTTVRWRNLARTGGFSVGTSSSGYVVAAQTRSLDRNFGGRRLHLETDGWKNCKINQEDLGRISQSLHRATWWINLLEWYRSGSSYVVAVLLIASDSTLWRKYGNKCSPTHLRIEILKDNVRIALDAMSAAAPLRGPRHAKSSAKTIIRKGTSGYPGLTPIHPYRSNSQQSVSFGGSKDTAN